MRRLLTASIVLVVASLGLAGPALACGGLVAPNGTVRLLRTATLAAYHQGVEHYITSFRFTGGGAEVGSIVPLPGVPSEVERGGDWTLQRLEQETAQRRFATASGAAQVADEATSAQVLMERRIDALDLTVLKGGAEEVGRWAKEHGFALTPDAPEVLAFYAARSPIFLAARFDVEAAKGLGQGVGDGTPIHITIPTRTPWVPIRILALGRGQAEPVEADVYLLTGRKPSLLGLEGIRRGQSGEASDSLLDDLRSDKGTAWVPEQMWLTHLTVDAPASLLDHDLAISVEEDRLPSRVDAGYELAVAVPGPVIGDPPAYGTPPLWPFVVGTVALCTVVGLLVRRRVS